MKRFLNAFQRLLWLVIFLGSGVLAVYVYADVVAEGALLWFFVIWLYGTVGAYGLGELTDWAFKLSRDHNEPVLELLLDGAQRLVWLLIWTLAMFWVDILLAQAIGAWMLPVSLFVWLASGFAAFVCGEVTGWLTNTLAERLR